MCLTKLYDYIPPKRNSKRYKVLVVKPNNLHQLCSPYSTFNWCKGLNVARDSNDIPRADYGFHVLLTKADAIVAAREISDDFDFDTKFVVVELQVDGFNAGGRWRYLNEPIDSETWKNATIKKVFTASGRHDITKRFK